MTQFESIGTLAEIRAGYQHRPKDELDENGEFLLIQQKDIHADRAGVSFSTTARISPERDASKQRLQEGDVLFMGKGRTPFGCAVIDLPEPAVASSAFFILRPDTTRILPGYLAWVLNREKTRHELLKAAGTGVAMPVIRRRELEEQAIPLPPLDTQRKIAELHRLMAEEKELMQELADQKSQLIRGACEQLIRKTIQD